MVHKNKIIVIIFVLIIGVGLYSTVNYPPTSSSGMATGVSGACQYDAPACPCFVNGGNWNPTGDIISIAEQTVWDSGSQTGTKESCNEAFNTYNEDGSVDDYGNYAGQPFWQMSVGATHVEVAQMIAESPFSGAIRRSAWCSETISFWHRQAEIPYDNGYGGDESLDHWYTDWQVPSFNAMRYWYKTEERNSNDNLGGRGQWIKSKDVDINNFDPGVNAPCPGAYQQLMGVKQTRDGTYYWDLEDGHSQMVYEMTLYKLPNGKLLEYDLLMIEGNSGSRVRDSKRYSNAYLYHNNGLFNPENYLPNTSRKIRGWGIDLDASGNPLCDLDRIKEVTLDWSHVSKLEESTLGPIGQDKDDDKIISEYNHFAHAMHNEGVTIKINGEGADDIKIDPAHFVKGKIDLEMKYPLPIPYPVKAFVIHFGKNRPDTVIAQLGEDKITVEIDNKQDMAYLPLPKPSTIQDFQLSFLQASKSGIDIDGIYLREYVAVDIEGDEFLEE